MNDNQNLRISERVTRLEERGDQLRNEVDTHTNLLNKLETQIGNLVAEVGKIRTALYIMAAALTANVPALSNLAGQIKLYLFH